MKHPPSPAKLLEAEVTKQIRGFMEFRGWRAIRMQRTVVPGAFQSGEPGIPDFLFIRYLPTEFSGLSVACWVEMKRAKYGKLSEDQKRWRDRETHRGAVVLKADNIADFADQYEELFGWLHTETWVQGQQQISFEQAGDLQRLNQSLGKGGPAICQTESCAKG
ncbi:MAG TPA: hypothetical protein VKX25_19595 [Bryobacteraceae bacterium]|nr:hypothetical protein [Bryobacteraceae bacterium]